MGPESLALPGVERCWVHLWESLENRGKAILEPPPTEHARADKCAQSAAAAPSGAAYPACTEGMFAACFDQSLIPFCACECVPPEANCSPPLGPQYVHHVGPALTSRLINSREVLNFGHAAQLIRLKYVFLTGRSVTKLLPTPAQMSTSPSERIKTGGGRG